jgi:hypothetical protein
MTAKIASTVARSGCAIHFGAHFSSSSANLAGDLMAALADTAGAAAPLAGLQNDRRGTIVVLRKSFAEVHLDQPLCCTNVEKRTDIIDGSLRLRERIA